MAILFDKMPREIRDKIYRLLLLDEVDNVESNLAVPCSSLYPVILRTCKQAYEEAMPVSYEKNTFSFWSMADTRSWRGLCQHSWLRKYKFLEANFARIKCVGFLYVCVAPEADYLHAIISSRYIIMETPPLVATQTIHLSRLTRFTTFTAPDVHSKLFT